MIFYILKLWKQPSLLNKEHFFIQELILFIKKSGLPCSMSYILSHLIYLSWILFWYLSYILFISISYISTLLLFNMLNYFALSVCEWYELLDNGILKHWAWSLQT